MIVEIRDSVCSSCPWKIENAEQLTKHTILDMIENDVISACHQEQAKCKGATCTTGVELYAKQCVDNNEPFVVCRGFQEARTRAKLEPQSKMLQYLDLYQERLGFSKGLVGLDYIKETSSTLNTTADLNSDQKAPII